jgi:hypothetical protein
MQVTNIIKIVLCNLLLLCLSCNYGTQKVNIAPYEILHDNSSKVWVLKSQFENEIDITPINRLEKWIITFYSDQTFVLTTLEHFSDYSLHQGEFNFNTDNTKLIYNWNSGQKDENTIITIDRQNLIYTLEQGNHILLKMHFIPIDKIQPPTEIDIF